MTKKRSHYNSKAKAVQYFGQHYNSMGTRLQKSGAITTVWVLDYKKAEPLQQHG
jgi:hypothetical protein